MRSVAFLLLVVACDAPVDPTTDAGPNEPPDFANVLDESSLAALASDEGFVKYLAPVSAGQAPITSCTFQNTARFPFHLPFLNAQPGGEDLSFDDYIALVLQRGTRTWWGGDVSFSNDDHPLTQESGTLYFTLYTEDTPGNRMVIDDVRAVHAIFTSCAPSLAEQLACVPTSTEQRDTLELIAVELAAEGIAVVP